MSLYGTTLTYMHKVGLINYIVKVFLFMYEVVYTCLIDV